MKTIKTNKAELLLVKVPIFDYYMISNIQIDNDLIGMTNDLFKPKYLKTLLSGDYQIVNTLSKLTEEQAKKVVDAYNVLIGGNNGKYYYDYVKKEYKLYTALESFHSLMEVNEVYLRNPHYEMPKWRNYTDRETFRKAILK